MPINANQLVCNKTYLSQRVIKIDYLSTDRTSITVLKCAILPTCYKEQMQNAKLQMQNEFT